jgi:hypothetical protein
MEFRHAALAASVRSLATSPDVDESAIGENFLTEENVGGQRRDRFEALNASQTNIKVAAKRYFDLHVQGSGLGHLPSTFDVAVNGHLMCPATIEPNQKIVRLERIDAILMKAGLEFSRLKDDLSRRDANALHEFVGQFQFYPGERPSFVALKSEVEEDLDEADWLSRLIDRMGLYHHFGGAPGVTLSFALMEYKVEDVLERTRLPAIDRPFAVATVLECQNNPAFFPVPTGGDHGFTVDLVERDPPRPSPREILHCRFDYDVGHVNRLEQWTRTARPDLSAARGRHRDMLRRETGRVDFGD